MAWISSRLHLPQAFANPEGGTVQSGAASITSAPGRVTVNQTSERAVVNWKGFSIDSGETTTFVQPSSKAAVLNRVTGNSISRLNGTLNANGQVYLVNKSGVVIGKSGRVNTAGFTASTHDVANAEFMAGGDLLFRGSSGASVINYGRIKATDGDVTLIARQVENHGRVTARKGSVTLAGTTEVLVRPSGTDGQRVFIKSDSGNGTVVNTGSIRATAVELRAAGGNEYALAVNNTGVIRATGVDRSGGRIVLKAERGGSVRNSGSLIARSKAAGARGGRVEVTSAGGSVLLTSASRVDVSSTGADGIGGTVHIGGGYQGKDAAVANAREVTVEAGAEINADGGPGNGKGGTAIVWSDERTSFPGTISAQGPGRDVAGSGGFVEVSSKGLLDYRGSVFTAGGTFLLDPAILEVIATGSSGTIAGASLLEVDDLLADLASGSVILDATSYITVNTAIAWNSAYNLTFETPTLNLNAPITFNGAGTITASALSPTTINVGAAGKIQNAVDAASANPSTPAIVNLAPTTYFENVTVFFKSITIRGDAATNRTTVNGNGDLSTEGGSIATGLGDGSVIYTVSNAGTIRLENLTITNGRRTDGIAGGGLASWGTETLFLTNSTVRGNLALNGGGVVNGFGTMIITNSTISGNTATDMGGGILTQGTLTLINSTVSGNTAVTGGGIFNYYLPVTATSSTIAANTATTRGGGFASFDGALTISNSIVALNTSPDGPNISASVNDNGYNLVGNSQGMNFLTPQAGSTYLNVSDANAGLAPLGWYGGPTQTHALFNTSLALGHGYTPSVGSTDTDQRGKSRPASAASDIGAFEAQFGLPSSYIVTNTRDYDPFAAVAPVGGSLRFALMGNLAEKPTTVTFNIPTSDSGYNSGTGVWTIMRTPTSVAFIVGHALTIDATTQPGYVAGGKPVITVNGNNSTFNSNSSVFYFSPGAGQVATLNAVTVTNGRGVLDVFRAGGGIYVNNGIINIRNSVITGNRANLGAGIFVRTGVADIDATTINANLGGVFGGGVHVGNGYVTIRNSTINNHSVTVGGGGVYVDNGHVDIINTTISGNRVTSPGFSFGGGVYLGDGADTPVSATIFNSTIAFNTSG
ncbi:MAG TPA: filamentous hemagglutinin N-terminal domain-containing protein, partial [Roseimicrobium sp.]|nr:filamentous hemagglutinin N-terminal domain-containing protein [Roseimicrobium sp.]